MTTGSAFRALAAVCAAILVPAAHALDPHRLLDQYIRARWTDEQGYTGGTVHAFAQTPDGYLWIGAENGLARFDGLTFRTFNHSNTEAFPASTVQGLATDAEGALWILLQSRELVRYHDGKFEPVERAPGVTAIASGRRRDVLMVRSEGSMRYVDRKFVPILPAGGAASRLIVSVAEASDGTVWMGSRDHGALALRDGRAFEPAGLPDRKVNCLLPGDAGTVWMGTDRGLALWNGLEISQSGTPAPLRSALVFAMFRDHDSNVWVGTAHGLMRMTPQGEFAQDTREPPAEPVTALFEGREGNLWIGRGRGFERWHDRVFLSYAPPVATTPENNGPVYADPSGRAWFGPSTGGLYWLKGAERHEVTLAGPGRDVVYSIDGGPGEVWIGRQHGGLTHLRSDGADWTAETFTSANGLARGAVYTVHRSRDGSVWAGTLSGGVSHVSGGRVTTYTTSNGLASNTVSAIEEGADGAMWFATANGLSAFAQDRWQVYTSAEGLPPARINCLFVDDSGVLWIGTDVGLAFLRNGRVYSPRTAAESLLEEVFGIAGDSLGSLWIATSRHVLKVQRSQLQDEAATALPREFGPADGIPAPEGVRRDRSVVKDAAGQIWLSLRRGISIVEPARVSAISVPAMVHIESVLADGNPIDIGTPLKIPASRVRIRFDFLALSLSVPDRVRYRYRLDGLDEAWSDPTPARETVYMNLPPRAYRFRVIACNSDGIWNSVEAGIGMEVVPALWETWQFRVSVLAALGLASLAIYRLRLRRLTKELNIGFEERLDERTRIAQDLHDTLLQGLLATSMHLHLAVDGMPAESNLRPQIERVLTLLQQVIDESRNAVRGLRRAGLDVDDLESSLSKVREELAVPESIEFRIIVCGQRRPLSPLIRDHVYRIGREGLSNAFRHSGAGMVELEINYGGGDLRLAVRDSGRGIDERVLRSGREGHWGLIGMRESAEKMGGQFKVRSHAGSGTELDLTVPGHIAFTPPHSGRTPRWRSWFRRKAEASPPKVPPTG